MVPSASPTPMVRPGGGIANISGCSTGRDLPSARLISKGRNGRAWCILRSCSMVIAARSFTVNKARDDCRLHREV